MPQYDYRYLDGNQEQFTTFQTMAEDPHVEFNGRPCEKTVQRPSVRTEYGAGSNTNPVEMMSIAVDSEEEIAAFRDRNPGVEISHDRNSPLFGVPIAKSMSQKNKVLDREGFVDMKGYH